MPLPTPTDAVTMGLTALAVTLADEPRAQRFLVLTGIDADALRRSACESSLLAALIRFLEAHEPDLLAVAKDIGVSPHVLVEARRELEGNEER